MNNSKSYFFFKRLVLCFILVCFIWYFYSGMMLQHLWDSPFLYKGADPVYWVFYLSGFYKLILNNGFSAGITDFLIITSLVFSIIRVQSNKPVLLSGFLILIYQVMFNMKLGYHTHHLFGFHFALLPFYFPGKYFKNTSDLARFLVCLTYLMAGIFKLSGGGWHFNGSFSHVLNYQLSAYFYFYPDGFRTTLAIWLIDHQTIASVIYLLAMLLQLTFISGFFTKRLDWLLGTGVILFHLMDWVLMNLGVFMSMSILSYLFFIREKVQN